MATLTGWIATSAGVVFAAWAVYVSLVEHPARMGAGPEVAVAQFRESYRRAAPWQATFSGLCLISGGLAAWLRSDWVWALGAAAVGLAIPFTVVVIRPTNRRLLGDGAPGGNPAELLTRWGRLHWVRSLLGLVGAVALLSRLGLR